MSDDCSKRRCEKKKKVFQGKAYIPDDHIQLISKYFQGANLNLNFTVDDEEKPSDKDCCKKKRKTRSRSRKRFRKKRRRKSKRCKCCKCHEEKCEVPKNCCCGTAPVKCPPKPENETCCDQRDPCAPPLRNCCCGGKNAKPVKPDCGQPRPYPCCQGKTHQAPMRPSVCCCQKPLEPEPEKICCCCGRPCVDESNDETKNSNKTKHDTSGKGKTKEKSKSKMVEDGNHQHTSCCCRCNDHGDREDADTDENRKGVSKNGKNKSHKKGSKKPPPPELSESSDSTPSKASGKNVNQVYVSKKVSSLETDEVYGRYWYHRPPLENTITHCDNDANPGPGPSGCRSDQRPSEDGGPCDGRPYPPNSACACNALQYSETGNRFRRGAGKCMACKEPMCLLCKMNICECDCDKPNFVICNPCKHRLTPKPPKKPCPPKKPKPINQTQQGNGGCDEAMFLLPLLASMQASMQGNSNFQQCNC